MMLFWASKTQSTILCYMVNFVGLENRDYDRGDPPRWPCDSLLSVGVGTIFADRRRSLSRFARGLKPRGYYGKFYSFA
jgi:hypothetical protein